MRRKYFALDVASRPRIHPGRGRWKGWLLRNPRIIIRDFVGGCGPLLALDFDGTLAPIVRGPHRVRMRARTVRLVRALSRYANLALISGRSRADLASRTRRVPARFRIGNHGIEWGSRPARKRDRRDLLRVAGWRRVLGPRLAGAPGVRVEDKRYTLAIHYREAPDPAKALATIRNAIRGLRGCTKVGGKAVVNLVPTGADDKGKAVLRLRRRTRADRILYIGDDDTDESVFRLIGRRCPWLLGVRVGHPRAGAPRSRASFLLRGQGDVDRFLARLLREFEKRGRL